MTTPTNQNLEIGGYGYEIPQQGPFAGRPTVFFGFQHEDERREHWINGSGFHNNVKRDVGSVMKMWEKYGWRRKINGNAVNVVITGGEPLSDENINGTEALLTVLNRGNVFIETGGLHQPSHEIEEVSEGYIIRQNPSQLVKDGENDRVYGPMMDLADRIRSGDGHFVFEMRENNDFDALQQATRLYRIPRGRTWLLPTGDEYEKMADKCEETAKDRPYGYADWSSPEEDEEE